MQNTAVVRLINNELIWYRAGASEKPVRLSDSEALASVQAQIAQSRCKVCFAAPGVDVRLLALELSADEKKHLLSSLPFMLEEQVAQDIDDLHFAAKPIEKLRYCVGVCDLQKMQHWQSVLEPVLATTQWLPEYLLLPWRLGEYCVLVEGDSILVRTGEYAGFSTDKAMLPMLLSALDAEQPTAVVVYGQDQVADTSLLPDSLQQKVQWRRGDFSAALMLTDDAPDFNLLQGNFAARLPLQRWWREWKLVACVFAAVFCLQLLATYNDYRNLRAVNLSLRAAVEQSYRQANPRGAIVDPEKQLQRQLNDLRGTTQQSGFVSLLQGVGSVLSQHSDTAVASINYSQRGGEIRMNIIASDFASVEKIRTGINGAGLVAVMESSSAQQGGRVRARLRVGGS